MAKRENVFRIKGRVLDRTTRNGIAGLRVEAWDKDLIFNDLVGSEVTDEQGKFQMGFTESYFRELFFDRRPDLFFKVFRDGKLIKSTEDSVQWNVRAGDTDFEIEVDIRDTGGSAGEGLEGRIVLEDGLPAEELTLRLYRRDFGGKATLLKETSTRADGQYAFTYAADGKAVSLEVRAVDGQGDEVRLSGSGFFGSNGDPLNLVVPLKVHSPVAEYQRITENLEGEIGKQGKLGDALEDKERRDISLLHQATGWDARLIVLAATADRLSGETSIPRPALYALLRAGLPSKKEELARVSTAAVEKALSKAVQAGIVSLDEPKVAEARRAFEVFSREIRRTEKVSGATSSFGELLAKSGLDDTESQKFEDVYLSHGGTGAELWEKARQADIPDAKISRLRLQGKLAFLTLNNAELTARLQEEIGTPTNLGKLVEKDFHRKETWKTQLTDMAGNEEALQKLIPPAYLGDKVEERLDAYTADLARQVRRTFPTKVVARMVATDELQLGKDHVVAKESFGAFFKKAEGLGYAFGRTAVDAFVRQNKEAVLAGIPSDQVASTLESVKRIHRLYQITPSDASLKVLSELGFKSAHDVTAFTENEFLRRYGDKFGSVEEARLVVRKARQVTTVVYSFFTAAKQLDAALNVYALSPRPEVREAAKNELIKHYPSVEMLFGSLDFCECEHCRSVLSPAAYLVDLFEFVNPGEPRWQSFLDEWKDKHNQKAYGADYGYLQPFDALIERRPDLPHLPLTCENTNTVLPYIDLVNEILEYFIANGKLDERAAHDTGDATTEELLAEPQNVIRAAYDKLREAGYPLALPFDLWIETVRRFCNYFETPLARLLEAFRSKDDLLAPAQPFDRSTIFIESLGLSPAETAFFIEADPLLKWYELYGFDTAASATNEATDGTGQRIDLNSAKALSRRLDVTYKEIAEIVQTGFVNPRLTRVSLLYKLGLTIQDARLYKDHRLFYELNKDLIGKERSALPPADQLRFDALSSKVPNTERTGWEIVGEVAAFEQRLTDLATTFNAQLNDLQTYVQNLPYDEILVLADPDTGCNFDGTTLQYAERVKKADPIAFLRINLFVRLWRKLGWSIEETDRALSAFIPPSAPFNANPANLAKRPLKTALVYLAHLKALDEKVKIGKQSRLKFLTLWTDMATTGRKPLYAQLFLTRSVLKSDPVFDDALGEYLVAAKVAAVAQSRKHGVQLENIAPGDKIDPVPFVGEVKLELLYDALLEVQHLSFQGVLSDGDKATLNALFPSPVLSSLLDAVQVKAREFSLIKGHLLALQGALSLTADEIGRILADAGKSAETADLSVPNVSLLYKYGLLAKALNLSVRELIGLKQLSGRDPFKSLHPDPLMTIEEDHPFSQTLRFIEIAEEVKESGLKIEDLEYLLRHRFDEAGKYRPDSEGTLALLKTLAEGVRAIRTELAVPDDPSAMSEEVLRQKLGLALPAEVVERFLAMMNGTVEFTATKTGLEKVDELTMATFSDGERIRQLSYKEVPHKEQKLTLLGVLFDAQKTALETKFDGVLSPAQKVAFAELLGGVRDQAKEFFDRNLRKQAPNIQPAPGFLDAADFDLLFNPDLALAPGETEQDRVRNRRTRLANAFLPFLQARLIRQFIVQTMIAHTGADPVLVESLVTDKRLLGGLEPLLDAFAATGERGLTATFFASDDGTDPPFPPLLFADADTDLRDADHKQLRPAGAKSARFEGYLEVPTPGAYRFFVVLDKQDAEAELRFPNLPRLLPKRVADSEPYEFGGGPDDYVELKAGLPYRFTLDLHKLNGGEARLLVQGETMPKESVSQLTLYPLATIQGAERAVLLLMKALRLAQSLSLNEREIRYLLTHAADFGGVNLSQLPTQSGGDSPAEKLAATERFAQFLRLAAYARLRHDLAGGTDDLVSIFEADERAAKEVTDAKKLEKLNQEVYPLIAKLTRRDEATIKATTRALVPAPAVPAFESEKPLWRLWEALQVVERFGVPVASLMDWTRIVGPAVTSEQRFEIARGVKEAIKARFDAESWQRVCQPIFDKLRQHQRDALVVHVMHQHGFARMEQLFEYFLIDPGMEPVVQTSRLRLAISSMQTFIQRCLLNLEPRVNPSAFNAQHWEWMKRYRVWEANRKIFLFPENWLEPEFRDDKTHLFKELEGALLQDDVSKELAEDAFFRYVKQLESMARLQMVTMYAEENSLGSNVLHVIGRTFSLPHKYFYRRYSNQMWTPWEPVTAEIEGDHVAAVVWRDRLHLFWLTFLEKAKPPAAKSVTLDLKMTVSTTISKEVEVQLNWSELFQGEWTTREAGGFGNSLRRDVSLEFDRRNVFIHVSKEYEEGEERAVRINLTGGGLGGAFRVVSKNSPPDGDATSLAVLIWPYAQDHPNPTTVAGIGRLQVSFIKQIITLNAGTPDFISGTEEILREGSTFSLLQSSNLGTLTEEALHAIGAIIFGSPPPAGMTVPQVLALYTTAERELLIRPFFYQDRQHTFFVEPMLTETTIDEWEEWIVVSPPPRRPWDQVAWWEEVPLAAERPYKKPIPIDPSAEYTVNPKGDWVTNPTTAIEFGQTVMGASGPLTDLGGGALGARTLATDGYTVVGAGGLNHVPMQNAERRF
jgi:Neuraminidase-like domain/Salmonella virulence plasmid 28.1kDa A protein